jgi:hypothetical protein
MDLTIEDLWTFLYGHIPTSAPVWPPDVFALCAAVLQRSGAYIHVVKKWPPTGSTQDWTELITKVAEKWRSAVVGDTPVPSEVTGWWSLIVEARQLTISELRQHIPICEALLQLAAAADECCVNVGVPSSEADDAFEGLVDAQLRATEGATLAKGVHSSRCKVLPKMHTPQKGITIRSLSHNLALCQGGDIRVCWLRVPSAPSSRSLNLLLLPWPLVVAPKQFQPTEPTHGSLLNMAAGNGFFSYEPPRLKALIDNVANIIKRAEESVGHIDGVICPELAMTIEDHEQLRTEVVAKNKFLISGVSSAADGEEFGRNFLRFDLPLSEKHFTTIEQPKHHRWCLDRSQILQYGIGARLDPTIRWWEHTAVEDRCLTFVAMRPWLTTCVLICEDLARQDPVAEIVRAIGPNLVIALLMDGPQFRSRWSARYATVLADDPGSSVLTLTSRGMAMMSRPGGHSASRVVALWKDASTPEAREIEFSDKSAGVVLSLSVEYLNEWSADGRDDNFATGYPLLVGVHEVSTT